MLVIRLRRTGKIHQPTYRIVVTDRRKSVYSPYIEKIGEYNPKTKAVLLDKEKSMDWMKKGAKPSDTISKIFKKEGLEHKSIIIKTYRAISKKELEKQKAEEEAEKAKEQAEKEAAKEAFEEKVEAEKAAQPTSEEKLQEAATESIAEVKAEDAEKEAEKPEDASDKPAEAEEASEKPEA